MLSIFDCCSLQKIGAKIVTKQATQPHHILFVPAPCYSKIEKVLFLFNIHCTRNQCDENDLPILARGNVESGICW